MNKTNLFLLSSLIAVLAVVGIVAFVNKPDLGGAFAGGITPTVLFTASTATNSVTPILSNLYVNGGISAGGVSANNQITGQYTAITVYPTAAATLGSSTIVLSATTTQTSYSASGFVVGDPCEVQYNFTTSTLMTSGNVTAVSGSNVTATVQFFNATGATISENVTSTITGVSSTVKTTCFSTGV